MSVTCESNPIVIRLNRLMICRVTANGLAGNGMCAMSPVGMLDIADGVPKQVATICRVGS